ncbi:hypothetical protein CBR_g8452 [Chara braunii]|uniref:Uncharacterized protein n=1 Tax=Chara braunii TaxID=69332 RepID=A0A388KM73_CHABU|nr:hypothetical protein CBR_g8452 [Chara braunii]|eukprot:GBG71150.1 hypothetical protein CBR_g8452 [Chara braunii]
MRILWQYTMEYVSGIGGCVVFICGGGFRAYSHQDVFSALDAIAGQCYPNWGLPDAAPNKVMKTVSTIARTGDLMYSTHDIRKLGKWPCQLFWEAFPTGSGPLDRTTYLFTYIDAHPERPSLELMMETYFNEMPQYQGVQIEDIQFLRFVFAMFPTYRDSPLPAAFDRVLQVGDASGIQSPLSFGGFGSIARHLKRLASG